LLFLTQLTLVSLRPCGSSSAKTSSGCAAASKSAANTQSSHKFQHTCHFGHSVHRGRLLSSSRTLLAFIYCARAVFAPYTSLVVQSVHCSFTHVMREGARSQRHECSGVSPHLQDLEHLQCLSCHCYVITSRVLVRDLEKIVEHILYQSQPRPLDISDLAGQPIQAFV